ncbi:thioredoxin family protein, partial [Candidatus Parcubacteria bacterium]|nr:thioredoxin family protein [Candidatus Parcubacteria bacterium]
MQKKFLILGAVLLISLGFLSYGLKQGNKKQEVPPQGLAIFFFYSDSCPYCAKMKPFLEDLAQKNEKIVLNEIKVSTKQGSQQLLGFYEQYKVPKEAFGSVPIVFIKDKYFVGYSESNNEAIADYLAGATLEQLEEANTFANDETEQVEKGFVKIPFLGEIDPSKYSLGALAVILGFFDGFNVCSLGALVLILGMVLVLKSRKKILFFGSIYIMATALVYGVLILLWYKLFVFLAPFLQIMEVLVGVLGLAGGIYFLQDFFEFRKKGAQCTSKNNRVMKWLSERIQKVLKSEKKSILAIGISVLAFSVIITVVEFP